MLAKWTWAPLEKPKSFSKSVHRQAPERACCERRETPGAAHPIALWRMEHRKAGIALTTIVLAGAFVVPAGGTESLVRKADVADRSFEAFLPPASSDVPWLTIDKRTKLPKGDFPIGRNADVGPLILQMPNIQHAEFALGGR